MIMMLHYWCCSRHFDTLGSILLSDINVEILLAPCIHINIQIYVDCLFLLLLGVSNWSY